jgi:hypothetical protein
MILLAGAALALTACGGNTSSTEANEANDTVTADNMMVDPNMSMDANGSIGAANMGAGTSAGGTVDSNTANLMAKDATTHDPDTNLSNGI